MSDGGGARPDWLDPRVSRTEEPRAGALPDGRLSMTIFGPGDGEAIVVRLPDGRVGVVDGCKEPHNPDTGSPDPVRRLLRDLGVEGLCFACLTHPHDDHVRGLGQTARAHPPEHIWWAGTETVRFLDQLAENLRRRKGRARAVAGEPLPAGGLEGFVAILRRSLEGQFGDAAPRLRTLMDHKRLFHDPDTGVTIDSVLPATADVMRRVADVFDGRTTDHPNTLSGALLVRWGAAGALLAGDATDEHSHDHGGWSGLDCELPRLQVVNVAHHGSGPAHCDELWARLRPEMAIVTPKSRASGTQPPRPEMISHLIDRCGSVVITSPPAWLGEEAGRGLECWPSPPEPRPAPNERVAGVPARRRHRWPDRERLRSAVTVVLGEDGALESIELHGLAGTYRRRPAGAEEPCG